ncbi:hypothetical protein GUJ93_ZPchr0010g11122 [Zizania palustris]|uniref:Uncharacterized protein n=1 Tax=Zizania palustris TaxID=103762 RepID=A0A8J6BJH7_ZIZPA|nr:hypothetical protein GUJ93_ZPchr0010g11122 [Zizania palustris]
MSQFHSSQHGGDSDVQMWQQQMMYKQLQEYERQQQHDHGARMQNSFGQFNAPPKQSPADQFPTMVNEMPMREPSSYPWSNNFSAVSSRFGSNSQMFNNNNPLLDQHFGVSPGTSNFVNGAVSSNIQNLMRSMGSVNNKINQYSFPASMSKGFENQYSQLPGFHNAMARAGSDQSDKAGRFASSTNSFQSEHGLSGNQYSQFPGFHNAMARVGSDQSDKTGRFASSTNLFQSEHGLSEQVMPNNLQNFHENGSVLSDSSTQSQGGNMKTGSPVPVNNLLHGFHLQDFNGRINQVECQSGTHVGPASTAASLDPMEEKILYGDDNNFTGLLGDEDSSGGVLGHDSSSDNGNSNIPVSSLGGSWSALMQEAVQSISSKNGLHEEWSGVNFQNTDQTYTNNLTFPGLEQRHHGATNNMNQHSASPNAQPSPSNDGSSGTMNNKQFTNFQHATESPYGQQEKFSYGSTFASINSHTATEINDRFVQPNLKQSHSGDCGSHEQVNLSNGIWAQQKPGLSQDVQALGLFQQNSYSQNDWNVQNSRGQEINNVPNISTSDRSLWKSGVNTHSFNTFQQSKPDVNAVQVPDDCYRSKNAVTMTSDLQGNSLEQGRADFRQIYTNATSAEGHNLNNGHHLGNVFSARNPFAGMDAHNLGQSDQKMMGSSALPNHLSGTTGINAGHFPANSLSNDKFLSESIQPPNNQQRLVGNCQVTGNMVSTNEKIAILGEQLNSQHAMANNYSNEASFGGYDATLSQNKNRVVPTSQQMLQQFLQKVVNSNAVVAGNMPIRSVDITAAHQINQPLLEGFGLKLAPPMQRQPSSGNLWTSHTSVDIKPPDNSVPEEDKQQLPSTLGQTLSSCYPSQSSPFYSSDTDNTGLSTACAKYCSNNIQKCAYKHLGTAPGGIQHNKTTPNILQSMMFPNTVGDSNSRSSLKDDYQRTRVENPCDAATPTPNSECQETKRALENDAKSTSSEMPNANQMGYILSGKQNSLQGPVTQHDIINPSQEENMISSFNKASTCSDISLHGSSTPLYSQQKNYSLLHQMQAMKSADIDLDNTSGKKLKTTEKSCDGSQVEWTAAQRIPYGENSSARLCADYIEAPRVSNSLPPDVQMLSYAPRNSEEITSTMPSQVHLRELPSNDMATAQIDLQNQCSSLGTSSTENFDGLRINPQMSSWFQHDSYINGQNLAIYNARKIATPNNHPKVPWSMENSSVAGCGLYCSVGPEIPCGLKVSSVLGRPKKRKFKALMLVSWNQIINGHQKLTDMSTLGMDWAQATNKILDKVEDVADIQEDAPVATYTVAKLTIGDACSMTSNSSGDTGTLISIGDKSSEQTGNMMK